jgi:site-specific DNA-methyltransferase (adenine-specific)
MYLKTLSLGDIHPYERNPRINDKAVEPVMKSIQKDGYRARIIVDKDGVIIAGHTRYEAMKRLGWTEAEVWIADDMTPEQIADYRIRDNLTADFAEWDFSELEAEIEEMDLDFDMSEFEGFEDIQGGVSEPYTGQGATEYSEEDFGDEQFKCECPRCGFKFNP